MGVGIILLLLTVSISHLTYCRVEKWLSHKAHILEIAGSIPVSATKTISKGSVKVDSTFAKVQVHRHFGVYEN